MTKGVEERHKPPNESCAFHRFLHAFRVQERPIDQILEGIKLPSRMLLRQHNLEIGGWLVSKGRIRGHRIYLGFQKGCLEGFVVHLHVHLEFDFLYLTLAAADRILD
jgi:hypothetical protein